MMKWCDSFCDCHVMMLFLQFDVFVVNFVVDFVDKMGKVWRRGGRGWGSGDVGGW